MFVFIYLFIYIYIRLYHVQGPVKKEVNFGGTLFSQQTLPIWLRKKLLMQNIDKRITEIKLIL